MSEKEVPEVAKNDGGNVSSLSSSASRFSPEEQRRIWRKVDKRLLPILTVMYLFSFMDRANIGNARLQGLESQLGMTGNQYNITLTMFFIPYCLFELPSNLVLKRLRPSRKVVDLTIVHLVYLLIISWTPDRWLPSITVTWGIIATLMGLVRSYPQLIGVRICLGIAEAGLYPGVVYYLSLWYPRYMLQTRISLFFGAASLAGAFSGLLAYGISFMDGLGGLHGWSWIFIVEGIVTVLLGITAFWVLVDFPTTAKFLNEEERVFVLDRKKFDNSSSGEEEHFEMRHLWAAISDWQIWTLALINMTFVAPLYGITLFLPTIINSFGYSLTISQLLSIPHYIAATATVYAVGYASDSTQMRSPFLLASLIINLIGYSINLSGASSGVKYFGTFLCVIGSYAGIPGTATWLGNNLSGQYKRGIGIAIQIGLGNFGGAIACNIFRTKDAPRFLLGHGLELMFIGIGIVLIPFTVIAYTCINSSRDEKEHIGRATGEKDSEGQRELGDKAITFRYTL